MLNDSQQRKALVLSLLMVMLAQTAYIESYRGWTLDDQTNPSLLNAGCNDITRTSGTPIYVDAAQGSDDWAGTWSCPKATLLDALNISSANDEIILSTGQYHENVTVDNKDNLLIRAADGARVVFDGTRSIANDLNVSWGTADGNGIQEVTLPVDGWQLFLDHDEQVPARWPNAQFSNETVFNRSYWAEGTLTNSNNAYTIGWLTDAGPETGVHTGLNETVNATGLNPVGAIAVMNLGSFRSNSRIITDWNASNGTFAYDGNGVGWKSKHHAYFLEGKRELIDQDGEWWFNNTNNRLHYKAPSGQDANDLNLRVKVQPFAISVENSDGVTIQGIDFFGTTVNFNECDGCSFTNATLEYPSTSKRGLGIAGESEDDRWMTRFYRSKNSFIDNISIINTDGGAIEFHGSGGQSHNNTVNNSYFHAIDWSAADQKGLMTTIYEGGRDMYFTNNSVHLTGASSVLSIGDAPKVFYNEVWDVGHLQTDGAVVQVMQGEAPGAEIAYNWIHDVIKYGARFDAPIGQAGEGRNGTMHHNVIWNAAGGLMVKGDYHDIHNNTVFNSTGKNDIIFLTDGGINNKNSTLHRNAVDAMADHRSDDVFANPLPNGSHWNNWNGYVQGQQDKMTAGSGHTCALYSNSSVYCWGSNFLGALGDASTAGDSNVHEPGWVDLGVGRTATSIVHGGVAAHHGCAILDNNSLSCWGWNGQGQLGLGNTTNQGAATFVDLGTGRSPLKVTLGQLHTCVLLDNKSVYCMGDNQYGQVGDGTTVDKNSPTFVDFGNNRYAVDIEAGHVHTCALLDNGSVSCWGYNNYGQLGLGNTTTSVSVPTYVTIPSGRHVVSMGIGQHHTCFAYDDGDVACTGRNQQGQLGIGSTVQKTSLTATQSLGNPALKVVAGSYFSCALLNNGSVRCWGDNVYGQLGINTNIDSTSPATSVHFEAGSFAIDLISGLEHLCARLSNGSMACWGRNYIGQLGIGNVLNQDEPVVLENISSLSSTSIREMLVDPDNSDFRPKWGSHLHILNAGAYDADDSDPWTAGVSWTYSPMSDPISGCMDSIAINYNSNAVFSDGSCIYTTLSSSSSTLSLEVGVSMTPYTLTYSTPFLEDDKQTAASSGYVGAGTNIALDSNGAVHICSKTISTSNLYYTTNASGSWQSTTLDSSGNVGGDCFIIFDSDDDIHITYHDSTNSNLKYATKALSSAIAASNWDISTMDNNGNVGNFGSMAVDANDTLHVAYYADNGAVLKYATLAEGNTTWSREVVESTNDVGKYTSIALDSNGNPHITYHDDTNDDLRYTHKMGSSWAFTTLDSIGVSGKGTSLAIDSNDHLHVAYRTNSTEIAYMTNRSGSWVKTTLDANSTGSWGVNYINIMLDEGDDPHVVYSDMVDYDIFYMSNTRGTWERVLVAGDSISKTSEATMDENGGIHVAYYIDGSYDDIGYAAVRSLAHRPQFEIEPNLPNGVILGVENGTIYGTPLEFLDLTEYTVWANTTRTSAFTTFSMNVDWELMASVDYLETPKNTAITPITFNWTAWSSGVANATSSVFTSGDSGWYNDIVIDSNDKAHIVFYRDDNANIYHSTNASGSWVTSSIDTNNNVGKYCSIAIDSNDGLHVSYQYNTGNALKYAYKSTSSSTWSKTTVDNTGGKFTSIAIDSNDDPHIVYRDGGGNGGDLAYAKKTSGSWSVSSPVYSAGDIAGTSIAIDSNDDVHIAYYDADSSKKDMYHLTDASGSWVRTFLEDIGSNTGGTSVSIAIDPTTDEPGISYFDMGNTDLKYRSYSGSSWSVTTVSPSGDYGRFNSLAYDSLGNVHISHERNGADDLYYTSDKTGSWVTTAIHTTNSVGTNTAIAVDSNDDIHIAYRYNTGTDLYVATVQGHNTGSISRSNVAGATCSISPSLPNGLTLNQGTCTISGTPTSDGSNTTYNLTATSSTGVSKSGEFKIWVTYIAPSIAYSGSPFTFTVGTPITSITPSNTGDSAFWSSSPSLPAGLGLSSSGVISGTPTATSATALYNITASNSGGESTATISITVNAQPPSGLSYTTENMTLEKGTAMTINTPSVSGGAITSWEISPSLPSGLTLGTSDGKISGTPTVLQTTATTYTVWANNSGGSTSAQINITINDVAPSISYSTTEITGTKGVAISPHVGPTTSGGTITSWEISPYHGAAFHFNTGNGYISGTPGTLLSRTQYTIWANNSGGSSVAYVNVTINDVAPNTIVYSSHDLVLEKGTAMTTTTPAIGGGTVTTWEISPSIPNGLSFSSTTGAISGTPSSLQTTAVAYTIWANNSGGSASTQMNITINDQIASISYSTPVEISNNRLLSTITPTTTGGAVTSWEITPSLPTGLSFGTTNGSIWGTPENVTSNATYTIYANNSGGSTSATLTLNMNWTLTPSAEGAFITRNTSLSPDITWTINPSGAVSGATCSISPSLPTGLSLTSGNCTITGTPIATASNATYTIWANISSTSYSGQIWLEVGLNAPIPSYSPNSYTYTKGAAITPITATNTGGEVTTWDLDTTLPSGLSLGASNGTIWGTPDTITSTTTYTIWANNSAGSTSTTITFTVNDMTPSISYSLSSLSLLKGAQMSALAVTNSGGAIVSCSVSPSLPNGMSLSSTCELSGIPTVAATNASYTITATNTGGSDSTSIYIEVLNSGGTLTVTPTHSTGSVNATLASIAASYSHSLTIPSWTSGVTNTSVMINNSGSVAGTAIAAWDNGDLVIAWTRPIYSGTTQHVLAISVYDGSSWTTQDIDTASRTGYRPSIAIDNQGALHIAYLDRDNTNLRYATNASGSWVLSTLDNSSVNPNNDAAKTGIAIDNRGHVHIIHPVQGSGVWVLNYTTNVSGSFVSTTITDTTKDDGKYASLAIAGNGSLHISVYRDSGGSDLRYYTDESGAWTNETVHTGNNYGKDSAIALNSKDEVVIVYRRDDGSDDIYMSVGNRGSWTSSQVASNRNAMYLAVAIDSNDDVHISSHNSGGSSKDLEYFRNSSGSWVQTTLDSGVGGIFGSIVIDSNDDIHIAHADTIGANDLQYATAKGSGKGVTPNPVFSVSPSLPDGLLLNWKTGEITGTPTVASANTTYTLTALALGTTTTATFTLHVTGAPGSISYNDILGTNGVAITPVTPTISTNSTTGSVTTWAINASLPTGLTFGTSNGTIWGTPTQVIAGAVFTIWANNSAGSKSTTMNITINDVSVSSFTYASENITLSYYHTMTTTTPTTTGGSATSWAIGPSLPSGLTFNTATGAISGTPETLQTTAVTYTIWANNSGGSFSDQINITINDHSPAPINYFGDNLTLDYNQTITPIDRLEVKPDIIAAGEDHTCAIQSDGSVRCWGEGSFGRLGHGGGGDKNAPTATSSLGAGRTAIDITAGSTHTCAVLDNGSVACWGANNYGQLGDGTTTNRLTPTQTLSLGRPAIAVEAGSHFSTCALLDNGSVSCWGRNHKGQLGRGFTNSTADLSQRTPALTLPMPGGLPVVALDISHYMVCGVLSDGSIACWGQYGGGNTPSLQTFFNSSNPAIDVSTGRYAGCGLLENGSVTCWGIAWLGTGGESQSANAGVIWPNLGSGRTAVEVEMGRKHRCVLLDDDSVKCWGNDSYGQLGNGAGQGSKNAPYSTTFSSNLGLQSMSSGHWHTCIASKTNEIYCWGDGANGKQGDGSTSHNQNPGKTNHFSGTNPVMAYGEIISWAIHPAPPSGLTFDSTNGTLYGTPTAPLGQTNFIIYANNSGGSTSTIVTITINDQAPGPFQYNPENNTLTNNTATTIAPIFTHPGGNVTSWVINASLPSGLSFGTNNGTIYGTPTELWNQTAYTVWANNSGGSSVAYLNITVVDQLPSIAYSPSDLSLTNNTVSIDLPLEPTLTGPGEITSWVINASLPSGVSFGTNNGTIYGTPTELWNQTSYTVWANNSGGSSVAYLNITVVDELPTLSYPLTALNLTNNTVSADLPLNATLTGSGEILSWAINASLPTGLTFETSNGTIWGTPTELWTATAYTVYANNSGGSAMAYLNITVVDQVPTLSYSPASLNLINNTVSNDLPLAPTLAGPGEITSWAISETLPTGLNFGTNNGTIWGTPTSLMNLKTFTIWANNSGGSSSATVNINIIDEAPDISYSPDWFVLTNNTAMSPTATPTNAGGDIPSRMIDSPGDVGEFSSLAVDSYGYKHISYFDDTNNDLKYATDKSGAWVTTTVNTGYHVTNSYTSIAVDSSDDVHISFSTLQGTTYGIVYATDRSGSWVSTTIENSGSSIGQYNSIAVNSSGAIHISYDAQSTKDLKYASCSSSCTSASSWSKVTVDSSGDVGEYSSIAIDSNDALHISYRDSTNQDLKYATCSSSCTSASSWTNSTIDSGGNVGSRTSIAIDSNDAVHISYHDITNGDLKYATDQSGSWANTTVDAVGTVGQYTSIAIDSNDVVHISYYDATNKDLKYASNMQSSIQTGVGNVIKFIDRAGAVGRLSSLAVDSNGDVHVSYYDATNDDLKYAALQGVHPWKVHAYSISPSLPAGLKMNMNTGEISGTPTVLSTNTTYTITVSNTGGTNTTTITIEVVDQVPVLSYSPENLTLTKGIQNTNLPLSATLSGPGEIVTWEIDSTLPAGLHFGTGNGTVWGTPTVLLLTQTTYTIWANNTGGSTSATINITILDEGPGLFEYIPENNTWTNNSEVHLAPLFINQTVGNNSFWKIETGQAAGTHFEYVVGDVIYFDTAASGSNNELHAYNTTNGTSWLVADIDVGSSGSNPGYYMSPILVGEVLYFSANDGVDGHELWGFNTSNGSVWQVADIFSGVSGSNPGFYLELLVGEILYFSANDGSTGIELWAHNTSNHSTWQAADIHSTGSSTPGLHMYILVGDTMYFSATDGSTGSELWAHDTSNHSTWQVADISSGSPDGSPGQHMNPILIDDTLFFDADDGSTGIELWAHDITNLSTWQVADIRSGGLSSSPGLYMAVSVGDTVYFSANDGSVGHELWAHDTSNSSTWRVADINSGGGHSSPGEYMELLVGDTIYFSAYEGTLTQRLWAHDTSNRTTWKVDDAGQNPSYPVSVGDTIYYSAQTDIEGRELWAYDLYNGSAWMVADLSGSASSNPLQYLGLALDSTLYFSGSDVLTYGAGMFAYSPGIVDYRTNTGGVVTTWTINASLPNGVFIGTTNGTIYGTPTELWNQTSYMVWANNSGGSSVAYLNITVVDEVPVLSYSPNNLVLTKGNQSSDLPLNATLTGPGEIVTWTIEPSLPSGLNFGSNNGTIWGIPTVLQLSSVTYTVWGNNTGGSTSATVTITIIDQVPDISYSPNELNLTVNATSSSLPLFPTNTGGAVTTWAINASLPSGLTFGSSNGTIYGTSTELWNRTSYMVWANNSGGSNIAYLNITVVDEVPDLSYSPENLTLTMGLQHTDLPLNATLTGSGTIVSWEIEPSLPAGLNFGSNNGTIWGIPTVLQLSPVTYTVWGNNSGGSLNVTINITIIDTVPDIAYSPSELELMLYTSSNDLPLSPTNSGGNITSWAINASLPSGVFFGTTNGTIYGTPTELWNRTTYMVWANNSGGSSVAYLNITVDPRPPMFSYSPENLTLYKNTSSTDLPLSPTISFTGHDAPTEWTLVGTLPSGLNFGTTNGTFWGTPTQRMATTNYIVYGNNSGGSFSWSINITVLHQAPMFTYSSYNLTLVNNTAMTALEATSTGGDITSWRADPNMPAGLTLHSVNGTIFGIPTAVQSMTMYTIWGNNSGGSHAVYVNITIYDPAITLDYNPENLTLTRGVAMNGLSPSYSGIVDDWTIVPSLPAGLNFNHGVVSGTPDVNMTTTMFTVWANNTGGSSNHTINITILEPIVVLDYNPENLTLIRGVQMTTLSPIVSGGNVSNWSITPALPNGLNFGDGVISGASTVNMTLTMYTVWATTSGGTTSHTVNITVLEPSGNLSYIPENITLTRGLAMPTLHPTYSGGNIENWSIHPALPAGLNFSNGVISGTPTVNMTLTMYTVYANNSGGSAAATINITILEPVVDLLYNPNNLTLVRGTTMSPLLPTVSGGNVSEWSVVGVLPEGLNFSNGVFSGTPLVNMTQTQYLVYANTTGGSETAWVNITVLEPAVDISYNPYNITLIRNETMTSVSPIVAGGNVSDWAIVPDLPAGLNFVDGVISGTPEVNMTTTMFTVWANTTGGAASTTVNITILEPVLDFLYNPNNLVLTRNETMNATSPIFGNDAMPDEWGILPSLPAGLDFTNGTISGTPEVNMTTTVFTIFANNSAGTATAFLTITILEPVATVVYIPENITLTRGESNASIVPLLGGGMVASWSISPDLPEGLVFDNGSITGVPLVNSTNTTYTVMALNSGGMAYAFLNITVVEPVAILDFNERFLGTRSETLFNATVNNTGGMVASWEIEPALPKGVGLWDGWLWGTSSVNLSETTFTVWANNSGGSANITFTLEVREPVAIIDYPEAEITLVNGVSRGRFIPILDGGVPDNWSIEPALPPGLTFFNGNIIGVATTNLSQTTYTVWANNSGGIAMTTFNLTVNQPTFYARYPLTRVVLDVNETWVRLNPIYYFGDNQNPVWSITPTLPEGLAFENGRITGTPTEPSNETNYTISVVGEMVPIELYVIIEVRDKVDNTVKSVRNTTEVDQFTLPEYEEKDDSFDMYWICFPILLFLTLLCVAAINNFLALTAKDEDDPENDDKGDDEGDESGGD